MQLTMGNGTSATIARRATILGVACLLQGMLVASTNAQLPRIRLDSILPPGGQVGERVSVVIAGEMADAATELVFSHAGIEANQKRDPESEFRVAHRKPTHFDIQIDSHVPPGRYEVRALGPAGISAPRSFVVSRLANKKYESAGNSKQKPFVLQIGEAANVRCRANERDYFQFSAEQHRPLLIQVLAERIDSKMDAVFSIYAKGGKRLHKIRQSLSRDPILSFFPPADGDYIVEVSDATYQGNVNYRLELSELPWIESVFPPMAQSNVETKFTVYGYNLPGGLPVSGFERAGQLQSAEITFAPNFDAPTPQGVWRNPRAAAMARLNGDYFVFPDRLSMAPAVFLAETDAPIVRETEASQSVPQMVSMPAVIAGQFYPRRDRDYYEFTAEKNQPIWIEVSTEQFGLPTDPAIRVQRKTTTDGKVAIENIATADDIEGPPNNRNRRRFFTGTSDTAYRFKVPEDGTYVVSVVDQYNTTMDDPRLGYRLTIRPQRPNFQLITFADPERFPDDKVVRPNGLGLIPGGSAAIRVRLLAEHGFASNVSVAAHGLPEGVTATPLLLGRNTTEGLLILHASPAATPVVTPITVKGTSLLGNETLTRIAKPAAITRGVNNADSDATTSRLANDLQLAILDMKPAPVTLTPKSDTCVTCRGAKLPLQLSLQRRKDFKNVELTVSSIQAPAGLKIDAVKSKTGEVSVIPQVTDAKLRPGSYSLVLASKLKDKRPKNPTKVAEIKADLDKITTLLSNVEKAHSNQLALADKQKAIVGETIRRLAAVQSRAAEPRNKLTALLKREQQAAQVLKEKLELSIQNVADFRLQEQLEQAESQIAQTRTERNQLQQRFGQVMAEALQFETRLSQDQQQHKQATEKLSKLTQRVEAVRKEKAATDKRWKETEKVELQTDAEFWVFAKSITVEIKPSPVTMQAQAAQVAAGLTTEIGVLVQRDFGFTDQISIACEFPQGSRLSSTPLVLGKGITSGKLVVFADEESPQKSHTVKLKVRLKFNGLDITDETTTTIQVHAN